MANKEHVRLLKQGVEKWNHWRAKNPEIKPDLSGTSLRGVNLHRVNLSGVNLHAADLREADLCEANLYEANLRGTYLIWANLRGADLCEVDLIGFDLRGSNLCEAHLCKANLREANLRETKLNKADLSGANLYRAQLGEANLCEANLSRVDLRGAKLFRANLCEVDLHEGNLREANLSGANLSGANLSGANLSETHLSGVDLNGVDLSGVDLSGAHLNGVKLSEVNLSGADLRGADLRGADLRGANLRGVDLSKTQALKTNFDRAIFTGACLEDWNINSATNFDDAVCEYTYLKANQQDRRPREGNFKPGEFAALFQQALDTVDLIFKDGIDWQAFFKSFQDLRIQYAKQDLSIQAIEKKRDGVFVVRIEADEGADKASIESDAKQLYAAQLKNLEAQYEKQLRLQGEQHLEEIQGLIEAERQEKATLMGVLTTMASNQGPKFDLREAQFAGGFAETVQGDQIGSTINNQASETPSLAEAAAEIQDLLKQLEASNPTATKVDQTAFLNVMIPPTKRERFIGALKAAGGAAIEEVPYGAVLIALVEGWQKPGE